MPGSGINQVDDKQGFFNQLQEVLADPNFRRYLGDVGAKFSAGGTVGEALNPTEFIRKRQAAKAGQGLLGQILAGNTGGQKNSVADLNAAGGVATAATLGQSPAVVTPIGQKGANSETVKRTADGTTTTIVHPSEKNLSTFGTSVPFENIGKTPTAGQGGEGGSESPFFQALFQ